MAPRNVIVTGGSAGIGRATVELLAERGHQVGFVYRTREQDAAALCAQLDRHDRRVVAAQADLGDAEATMAAIDELCDRLGGDLHGLVNNAGVNRRATLGEETPEAFARVIGVNLAAPLFAAQRAVERMRGGGRIVNVTSVLDRVPLEGAAVYCASKAALAMVTQVLALELADRGITVNTVAPGHTATPMNFGGKPVDAYATRRSAIPAGRPAAPVEIAEAVAYFVSDAAAYTTGATLLVDGGLVLNSGPRSLERSPEFIANQKEDA